MLVSGEPVHTVDKGWSMLAETRKARMLSEPGIFSWDIVSDRLHGDSSVAYLLGLDAGDVQTGLPLTRYVERVHPEDRVALIQEIRTSVLSGSYFQLQLRVHTADEDYVEVVVFGRCFLDCGEPKCVSGVLHALPEANQDASAIGHLIAAHSIYERDGAKREASWIKNLLLKIISPDLRDNVVRLISS